MPTDPLVELKAADRLVQRLRRQAGLPPVAKPEDRQADDPKSKRQHDVDDPPNSKRLRAYRKANEAMIERRRLAVIRLILGGLGTDEAIERAKRENPWPWEKKAGGPLDLATGTAFVQTMIQHKRARLSKRNRRSPESQRARRLSVPNKRDKATGRFA
jgi:hypothetical protein